jgi:hypothetical protein
MRPKTLKIDEIRTDGDTQVRCQLDEQTVSDYADAIKRGETLPPVIVFDDGSAKWLASGFHRVAGHRAAGKREIAAEVHQGTREDARWFALGANKANGLRMTSADKAHAIRLALKTRPDLSNRAIAEHIGCDDMTVSKYRKELESTAEIRQSGKRTGLDGKTRSLPDDPPPVVDDPPPSIDDAPPVVDDGPSSLCSCCDAPCDEGKDCNVCNAGIGMKTKPTAGLAHPAKEPAGGRDAAPAGSPSIPRDQAGNEIPRPEIIAAFRRVDELTAICTALSRIKAQVLDLCEKHDPLVADIVATAFETDCNNARRHVADAKPYAVCPYCGGDGCQACKSRGWVSETTWKMSPEDMRKAMGAVK